MPSSRPSSRRPEPAGATMSNAVLVEETPPPSPLPENQRRTRSKSRTTRPVDPIVVLSSSPSSRSEPRRSSKRAVDETLRTGIDFGDPSKSSKRHRQRTRTVDPDQQTLGRFLPSSGKAAAGPGPSTTAGRREPNARKASANSAKARSDGLTKLDAISVLSSDDDRVNRRPVVPKQPRRAFPRQVLAGTGSQSSQSVQVIPSRDITPVPRQSASRRATATQETPRKAITSKILEEDIPVCGSQEDWERAVIRRASLSPQNRKSRILVAETVPSPRTKPNSHVLVEETVVQKKPSQPNPFYEGPSPSSHLPDYPSRGRKQPQAPSLDTDGHAAGVGTSIRESSNFPTNRAGASQPSKSRLAASSSARSSHSRSPLPSKQASSSKLCPSKTSSLTFGDEPTPTKANPLASFARSPTKSPVKRPLPPAPEEEVSPPQFMSVGVRRRMAFLGDEESYRPSPRTKFGKEMLQKSRANQAPVAASTSSRPQRVKSYPGKYTMPTVDTPIEKWPTTKGTVDSRPVKRRKSTAPDEEPMPYDPISSTPPRLSQQSVMSSFLSPPPETQAPLPTSSRSAAARSPLSQHSQASAGTPSQAKHRRLSQISHRPSSQLQHMSPRTPHREGTPPAFGSGDFFSKFAEFAGTPEPEESQVAETPSKRTTSATSPLARRVLSPQASQRSLGDATQPSHAESAPQQSPQDLATRLLAQAEEAARRRREELEEAERAREQRRLELEALLAEDEKDEEEVALNLSQVITTPTVTSPSRSPPPQRRKSTRVVPPKPEPVAPISEPPRRPKKDAQTLKNEKDFALLIKSSKIGQAQQAQWKLALANIAERNQARLDGAVKSEDTDNALDLQNLQNVDQEALRRALEEEAVDRCDEKARTLQTMSVFWESEEEEREPRTEAPTDVPPLGYLGPRELPLDLVNGLCSLIEEPDMILPLLSSGVVDTLSDATGMSATEWLFKLAFEAEDDISTVAAQQLLEVLARGQHEQAFLKSLSAYQVLEGVWGSLGAVGFDSLPDIDVRIGRQAACALVCEIASVMATQWLSSNDVVKVVSHLIRLSIDPSTTPALERAIASAIHGLVATYLQGHSVIDLASSLAVDLASLSLFHKSQAVLALGQASADMRALVQLLAIELLSPDSLSSLPKDATGPSQEQLEKALENLLQLLLAKPVDWIDIAAIVTLYVAAAAESAQFAQARTGDMGKHSPFTQLLLQAQQYISSVEHREPRAMVIKSRLNAIEACGRYTSQLVWNTKEKERLERHGLEAGRGGQARLSLGRPAAE